MARQRGRKSQRPRLSLKHRVEFSLVDTLLDNPIGRPLADEYYSRVNYRAYLLSDRWRKKRQRRLKLDKHRCVRCGSKTQLEIHHKTYARRGHESMRDLQTLCAKCHRAEHRKSKGKKR